MMKNLNCSATLTRFTAFAVIALLIFSSNNAAAQVNLAPGGSFTENFNSFVSNSSSLPTGWKIASDGTPARTVNTSYNSAGTTAANTMSLSSCNGISGGTYALRNTTASGTGGSDYCPGFISSGSATNGDIYLAITNNGASSISALTISYSVKKFRNGSNAAGFTVQMLSATSPTATGASWTALGSAFNISFATDGNNNCPGSTTPGGTANLPSATSSVTSQSYALGTPLAPGNTIYLAWNICASSGSTYTNGQLLGIDDVTIAACGTLTAGTVTPSANVALCSGYGPQTLSVYNYAPSTANLQWQKSTTSATTGFSDISGATSSSYTITSGSLAPGTYWFRANTVCGASVASSTAVQVTVSGTGTSPTINTPTITSCTGGAQTAFVVSNPGGGSFGALAGSAASTSTNYSGTLGNYYLQTGSTAGVGAFIFTNGSCQAVLSTTVNSSPTNSTPTTSICNGGVLLTSQTLNASPTGGTWSLVSSDGNIASTTSVPTTYTPASTGLKTIRYTLNGCNADKSFTVNSAPSTPGSITGPTAPCFSTTGLGYSITATGGITYTWAMPGGFTNTTGVNGTTGGGSNSISVNTGASGSGNITVYATNAAGCQSSNQSLAVAITAAPSQPGAFTASSTTVCQGYSYVYTVPNVAGLTYNWTFPTGTPAWSVNAGGTTNSVSVTAGANTGTVSVTASNACGASTARTVNVTTVNPAPSITLQPANTTTCADNTINLGVTGSGASTYQWQFYSSGVWTSATEGFYGLTGTTSNALVIDHPYTNDWNSYQFRVILSSAAGCSITSTAATTTVSNPIIQVPGTSSLVYSQNFGTSSGTLPAGWSTYAVPATAGTQWTVQTSSSSSGSYTGASGGANAMISISTGNPNTCYLQSELINTTGYTNLSIIWGARMTASFVSTPVLEYSPDGGTTWNEVPYYNNSQYDATNWEQENYGVKILLPSDAANISNLRLRWSAQLQPTNANYRIDDIQLYGVPLSTPNVTLCNSQTSFNLSYTTVNGSPNKYNLSVTPAIPGFSAITNAPLGSSPVSVTIPAGVTPGDYQFKFSAAESTSSCASTADQIYVVRINAIPTFTPTPTDITCHGYNDGKIQINASGNSPFQYSKNNGGAFSSGSNPYTFSALSGGTYNLVVKDNNGCTASANTNINDPAALTVAPDGGGPYAVSQTINFTSGANGGTGAYSYSWTGPSFTDASATPSITNATLANGGTYNLTVTDANHCQATGSTNVVVLNAYTWVGINGQDWATGNNWYPVAPAGGPNVCDANVYIPYINVQPIINSAVQVGGVQIEGSAIITVNASISVCKDWDGGIGTNAQILGGGPVIFNGTAAQNITGLTAVGEMEINNIAGATLQTGAALDIYTALDLHKGNFNVSAGSVTFKSTSVTQAGIIDNFSSGYTGTLTGNIHAERFYDLSQTFNQHFMGSPVNTPPLSQFGVSGTGGYVIPLTTCDETQMIHTSPYGTVFSYHESNGASCGMAQWYVETGGNAQNAVGYSILKYGSGTISLTGAPNLNSSYSVANLTNSGWSNQSYQHRNMSSGWQLLANPYLATLQMTTPSAGFDNQVQVWNTSGPYAGSYQPYVIGSGTPPVLAPFQAFMVHKTSAGGTATYNINGADRVRTAHQFFAASNNKLELAVTNTGNGMIDKTVVAFDEQATDQFDAGIDADKFGGALNRHTLYSVNNGKWMAINVLNSIANTSTVPVGFEPGRTGSYTFTFDGVSTFDPTVYILLEDLQTGIMHNVRNGAYSFTADSADNWNRFVLHFTPAAQVQITPASCAAPGVINVTQPGNAAWSYVVTNNGGQTLATGVLNQQNPITIQAPAGIYTVILTDNSLYTVSKNVVVDGSTELTASFVSPVTAAVQAPVTFTSTTQNATDYTWTFSDGAIVTGATAEHTFAQPGTYTITLKVTNANGCVSSIAQSITIEGVTGVNNVSADKTINLWSNENRVYIDFSKAGKVDAVISIYNVLGQQLSNEKYTNSNIYQKAINNVEAAYVIVSVRNNDSVTTKKLFIVNNK